MEIERVIGVDFGTSTSVIRVKRYENGNPIGEKLETKEVIFGGSGAMVPTLIMKKDDDPSVCYFGFEAQQKKKKFTNFHSFKMNLESNDPSVRAQARLLTEEFYCHLARQYKSQSEGGHLGNSDDKERTIISYPVKWSEETKQFMLETAKKAGFPNVTGMDEAQAAIQAVTVMSTDHLQKHGLLKNGVGANILLIDMGAGTTDLVLARYVPGDEPKTEILNTWPKSGDLQFGGREIDELLKNFFRDLLDEEDAEMVFRRIGSDKFKSWKEETVSPALSKNDSVSDFEVLDSCTEMMEIDLDEYCLDRAAFENCLADYLKQFPELVNGCLQNAGMTGGDVDLVIVTGGHSQWYFVNEMLSGRMPQFGGLTLPKIQENPARIIPISRPQETVALGLAYSGMHQAKPTRTSKKLTADPPAHAGSGQSESPVSKSSRDTPVDSGHGENIKPIFAMEIAQVFQGSGGTCIAGTVALGSVKTGEFVYAYDKAGGRTLCMRVKNIAVAGKQGAFDNNSCVAKGEFAVLLLNEVTQEDLSENMILFRDTGVHMRMSEAELKKIVEQWKRDNPEKPAQEEPTPPPPVQPADYGQTQSSGETWEGYVRSAADTVRSAADMVKQGIEQRRERELEEARRRVEAMQRDLKDIPYTPESEFELVSSGGNYVIKKYLGSSSVVSIPPNIRGRKVVEIGACAFGGPTVVQGNKNIEVVIIPNTIHNIGVRAFTGCFNLHTVIAHKGIETIGESAFWGCNKLQKFDFGMGEREPGHVCFPPGLKKLGPGAFTKYAVLGTTACIFKEIQLSRRTKVGGAFIGGKKGFDEKHSAVFYYD